MVKLPRSLESCKTNKIRELKKFLSVKTIMKLNLGQVEVLEIKIKKFAVVLQLLRTTQNLVILHCCFVRVEDGKQTYEEL